MLIDYVTAEGHRISYDTGGGYITQSDISEVADMYARLHPDKLPTNVWIKAEHYKNYAMGKIKGCHIGDDNGEPCLLESTGCGVLKVFPLPYHFKHFELMVGRKEDYDHYFLDEVFEDTVLDGCERET